MDYEKAYKEALERAKGLYEEVKLWQLENDIKKFETIFPELKENGDELTWLTKYIEEEAYSLSMDIRDNEDRIKLKKLQRSLAWLEKQKDKELPEVIDRETIDEYAYQCAYDLSHDWIKDTPTWDDVESACKLGAKWQENHNKDNMVEALRTEYEKGKADTRMSQKWNEEDEKTLSRIRAIVRNDNSSRVEDILWLKSLKERMKGE